MATRPRGGQVFEDFKPISEWKLSDDEDSHNLIIYLPGFTKDQIRVSTDGHNMIRVRGERLAADNKWSRFLEDFQVPENSEMNSIRAKLQGEILYITVPRKSAVVTKQPQEGGTTPTPKQTTTTPQKDQSRDEKTLKTQKPSEDNNNDVDNDDAEKRKRSDELLKEKQTALERGDNVIKKTVDKEEKNLKTNDGANEEDKVSKGKQIKESRPSAFAVGRRYKKAMEGIGDLSEERQLLVNIGVAVLVIMGISAYATYKFASAKDKN